LNVDELGGDAEESVEDHRADQTEHEDRSPAGVIGNSAPDGREDNCIRENNRHEGAEDAPLNDRAGITIERAEQFRRIERQQRQNDAKTEQVDEHHEKDDQHR